MLSPVLQIEESERFSNFPKCTPPQGGRPSRGSDMEEQQSLLM